MKQYFSYTYFLGVLIILLYSLVLINQSKHDETQIAEKWLVLSLSSSTDVNLFYPDEMKVFDQSTFYNEVTKGLSFFLIATEDEFQQLSVISQNICELTNGVLRLKVYYCHVE